jgi:N6-adenosine-specific RNA methylase IME4
MIFDLICADPPWNFVDPLKKMKRKTKRSARSQYSTLSLQEIKDLNVKSLANPNGCVLALWVPSSMLQEGLDTMKSWGFKQKQIFVWVKLKKKHESERILDNKTRVGMGRLFRQSHEIVLLGTSGKKPYRLLKNRSQRSVTFSLNVRHSQKPESLQDKLDLMFPDANKLEMFARRQRKDWYCLGDQIDGQKMNDAITNLIELTDV